MKLKTFADMAVTTKIPARKQKTVTVRAERNLLGQLIILSQSHNVSFEKLFKYSLYPIALSLATADGMLAKTHKAQLLHVLESECQQEAASIDFEKSVFVIDGNALIRAITNLPKMFGELSEIIFKVLPKADTVHFVTDSYHMNSIKTIEQSRR